MQLKIENKMNMSLELKEADKNFNRKISSVDIKEDLDDVTMEEVAMQLRKIGDEVDKECIGLPKLSCLKTGKLIWWLDLMRTL